MYTYTHYYGQFKIVILEIKFISRKVIVLISVLHFKIIGYSQLLRLSLQNNIYFVNSEKDKIFQGSIQRIQYEG